MSNTLTLIQKITVGAAGAASITFSNIPQTYTDLKIVTSVRSNRAGAINSFMRLYPNGNNTGITYKALFGSGGGGSVSSFTESTASQYVGEINATGSTANTFSSTEIYIPNYTSGAQKSYSVDFVVENEAPLAYMGLISELWANTNAITSIQLLDGLANFVQHSTFYLYGVTKFGVSTPSTAAAYATGGDIIKTDGTYWYHAFTSSGTFTPRKSLSCDVLVVAGGGSGGRTLDGNSFGSGGGGAGGVVYQTGRGVSNAKTVTIGAGGNSSNGTNTTFDTVNTITAAGGGRGGNGTATNATAGLAGGSGGGGVYASTAGGATTQGNSGGGTGYGFPGANGSPGAGVGAGGGGAGATGTVSNPGNQGGTGGAGLNTWSSWLSATSLGSGGFIAGGGGGGGYGNGSFSGGAGGSGGGGQGGGFASPGSALGISGSTNTGGGAGGSTQSYSIEGLTGGQGGSGLVIVRYLV